jgi:hypothetical protein
LDEVFTMKTRLMILAVAAALGFASTGYAKLSKDERKAEEARISDTYKADKDKCDSMKGNAKDVCMAEAKGHRKVAKAELDAKDKGTAKAQADARIAKAQADYDVAKEKCDDLKGNDKDVCQKDAKAALTRAKSDAKVSRESKEQNRKAADKVSDARKDANRDTRDAEYKAARERCDSLATDAKARCVDDVKARFGHS